MRKLLILAYVAAVLAVACGGAKPLVDAHEKAHAEPCSHEALAETVAKCVAHIKAECARGDKTCPVYVECRAKIDAWKECK